MKTFLVAGIACALALGLSGCSTTTSTKLLDNLQGCTRHYDGAVSGGMAGGQFSGTVKIDCVGPMAAAAAAKPAPAAP